MSGHSTPRLWISVAGSVTMMAALAGCQPELPPFSWKGEVIHFAANDPDAVCGDTLEWTDARAVGLKEAFGSRTWSDVDYYWVPDIWSEQTWCSDDAVGCSVDDRVYSTYLPHEHELVHALRKDDLPAVFEEGLAEVFGDAGWVFEPAPRERLITILETGDPVDYADYSRAGHFVAFLIETQGIESLFHFAELTEFGDNYSRVRTAFTAAYGFPIEQALVDYENFPECDPLAWMDKRIACAEPGTPLTPQLSSGVEFSLNLDCGESDVLGPHGTFMFTETILDIDPAIGLPLWIELIGDIGDDVSAALFSCGGCADTTVVWVSTEAPLAQLELPPGRYVLRMFRPLDDPGELGISLSF